MSSMNPFPNGEPIDLKDGVTYDPRTLEIRLLNGDVFLDYREACKITEGKRWGKESLVNCMASDICEDQSLTCTNWQCHDNRCWRPKDWYKYWLHQCTALHSCIRSIHIRIVDYIPRSVAMQLVRHTMGHPQPYIQSSRPDWTGKPRSPDPHEMKWCMFDFTPESFLHMCRKRLCNRTEEKTRRIVMKWVEGFKAMGRDSRHLTDMLFKAIGDLAVPQCEVLGAKKCPELKSCGKYKKFN